MYGRGTHGAPFRRVAIVDNDLITREGTRVVLEGVIGIKMVAAVDHPTALGWGGEWDTIDVAIIDASDLNRGDGDQFPGVAVVQAIRKRQRSSGPVVVVLTGQSLHPGLRRRMWEAGADFFYARDEGMTEDQLAGVVLCPEAHRRMDNMVGDLPAELGVGPRTRVNELLHKLDSPEVNTALDAGGAKKSDPHGSRSRWWDTLRERAGGPAGLRPVKANGDVALNQDSPSVTQLRKFWLAMTKVGDRDSR